MAEDKPLVSPEYSDPTVPNAEAVDIDDVNGLVPNIGATPTYNARKLVEQFRIQDNTLWVYDVENRTWFRLGQDTVYGGRVTSGAAGTPFPTGWSVTNPSTGNYQITHNLGHQSYAVTVTPESIVIPNFTSIANNTFNVNFRNTGGTDTDANFLFILTDES